MKNSFAKGNGVKKTQNEQNLLIIKCVIAVHHTRFDHLTFPFIYAKFEKFPILMAPIATVHICTYVIKSHSTARIFVAFNLKK